MVTVLAVAPLLAILHQASTRHAVCEHGALVESDHGSADVAPVDVSSDRTEGAPSCEADSTALHSHTHCAVGTLARAGVGVAAPVAGVVASLATWLAAHAPSERPFAHAILADAPKTSPPSRG
jgi:hypothetical protein